MTALRRSDRVLITGGAGYIGSVLTRRLLNNGLRVRVFDARFFGDGLSGEEHPLLENVHGDIRDVDLYRAALDGVDTVVHLAAVANDPSFDLDPALGRSVNYEALDHVMRLAKESGVKRFVYASSASVYGVSERPEVDEAHPLIPITDYNRYKAMGEEILFPLTGDTFETVAVRAATVSGVSTRQRLDLTVNMLTAQAVLAGEITVFGGTQYRPNIHVEDLVTAYQRLVLDASLGALNARPLNVGNENMTVGAIAELIARRVGIRTGADVALRRTPTDDVRSYRLTSNRLTTVLGVTPRYDVADACDDVAEAILDGRTPGALTDPRYYNVRWMKENTDAFHAG
ncbi:NAD-dependent epimerase/dehydratase family protein [Actinoplanes sp. NPDC049265]|uniref:NAD-dependent epimerase/dehydratase family protein n=1 Tax=Actinoplanes sp. NPDC049265 TaxID=3363902 RepID=UPI00372088E7